MWIVFFVVDSYGILMIFKRNSVVVVWKLSQNKTENMSKTRVFFYFAKRIIISLGVCLCGVNNKNMILKMSNVKSKKREKKRVRK